MTNNQVLAITRRRLQERGLSPETVQSLLCAIGNDLCDIQDQADRERLSMRERNRRRMTMKLVDRQVNEYARDEDPGIYNPEYSEPFPSDQFV